MRFIKDLISLLFMLPQKALNDSIKLINWTPDTGIYAKTVKVSNIDSLVMEHSLATSSFHLGGYCGDPQTGKTRWLAFDIDVHQENPQNCIRHPEELAENLVFQLSLFGLKSILEVSRGGKGYHVWVLFDKPVSIKRARLFALQVTSLIPEYLLETEQGTADPNKNRALEIYPKDFLFKELGILFPLAGGYSNPLATKIVDEPDGHVQDPEKLDIKDYLNDSRTLDHIAMDESVPVLDAIHSQESRVIRSVLPFVAPIVDKSELKYANYPIANPIDAFKRAVFSRFDPEKLYSDHLPSKVKYYKQSNGQEWMQLHDPSGNDRNPSAYVAMHPTDRYQRGTIFSFRGDFEITNPQTGEKTLKKTLNPVDYLTFTGKARSFQEACEVLSSETGVPLPRYIVRPNRDLIYADKISKKVSIYKMKRWLGITEDVMTLTFIFNDTELTISGCIVNKPDEKYPIGTLILKEKIAFPIVIGKTKARPDEENPFHPWILEETESEHIYLHQLLTLKTLDGNPSNFQPGILFIEMQTGIGWPDTKWKWAAERVLFHHQIWVPEKKYMYIYDPELGVWKTLSNIQMENLVSSYFETTNDLNDKNLRESITLINNDFRVVHGWEKIKPCQYIPVQNGAYNLISGKLEPHSPEHYFITSIPHALDFNATCPKIDKIFNEWEHKEELIDLLAYMLYPHYPKHKLFFLYGTGGNGKTVFLKIGKALLGTKNCSSLSFTQLLSDKFSLQGLEGKLANLSGELRKTNASETDVIKNLTGGDEVAGDVKYKDYKHFVSFAKLVFSGNLMPRFNDSSLGMMDRLYIIVFNRRFRGSNEEIPDLAEILANDDSEMEGLLLKCLVRLKEMVTTGSWKFRGEKSVEYYWEQHKTLSVAIKPFLDEYIEITRNPEKGIPSTEVYAAIHQWQDALGVEQSNINDIAKEMKLLGIIKKPFVSDHSREPRRHFMGIRWKKDPGYIDTRNWEEE